MGEAGISFRVVGWVAWAPDRNSESEWRAWAGATGPMIVDSEIAIPSVLRRRVTPLGQRALRAAWRLPESRTARLVFSSRHGEFSRTLSILDSIVRDEPVSPAEFSLSVHHALAGLLSIAAENRAGHTTIAAQGESFCCGLLEAAASVRESPEAPVIHVHFDEPPAPPYDVFARGTEETIAVALSLAPASGRDGLRLWTSPARANAASATPAHDFLKFALGDQTRVTIAGERLDWNLEKLDAPA